MVPVPRPGAGPSAAPGTAWGRALLGGAVIGALVAVAVVYAYYNDPWRPLAHSLGLWAALAGVMALGRRPGPAVAAAIATLAAAVVTFYVGLVIGHDIRWGDTDSVMVVDWDAVGLWLVLAGLAGAVLGAVGSRAARPDRSGAAAAAVLVGLPLGDAVVRLQLTGGVDAAVVVDVLVALLALGCTTTLNRRPVATLLCTAVVTGVGAVVLSLPDAMGLY